MNRTLLAGIVGGLVGGLATAELAVYTPQKGVAVQTANAAPGHPQDVLAASRIELRDASGKLRAELALSADGGPALFFFDSAGRNRLVMGLYSPAENEAPSLVLNDPQQRAAVLHEGSPLLIVAGAGSGKTRVLTHRIAYLLAERDVAPSQILAITFTNKAAGEMADRAARLTGARARSMWLMTFHSACVQILRREAKRFGYPSSFSIYDQADSQRLMAMVCRELELGRDRKRLRDRERRLRGRRQRSGHVNFHRLLLFRGSVRLLLVCDGVARRICGAQVLHNVRAKFRLHIIDRLARINRDKAEFRRQSPVFLDQVGLVALERFE